MRMKAALSAESPSLLSLLSSSNITGFIKSVNEIIKAIETKIVSSHSELAQGKHELDLTQKPEEDQLASIAAKNESLSMIKFNVNAAKQLVEEVT